MVKGILERLDAGEIIIGDGGFIFNMEKRGYVSGGSWTPEAVVEHPEAVRQLHREYLRAGADVMQTMTHYSSDDKLNYKQNTVGSKFTCKEINNAACRLAREVADEGGALVAGGISRTPAYTNGLGKEKCQEEFKKQVEVLVSNDVDFLMGESFQAVEEAEWAMEVIKTAGKPVALTLNLSACGGDINGVPTAECAIRVARAGADLIGVNCGFDPDHCLKTVAVMKAALESVGLKRHFICQPLAMWLPDAGMRNLRWVSCPEFPFALEGRTLTRWDCHKYARAAYDLGVRYIGGCCGFEAYQIRALAEELALERGRLPKASEKHGPWGEGLKQHTKPWVRARANRSYWESLKPASGRPDCPSMSDCQPPSDK